MEPDAVSNAVIMERLNGMAQDLMEVRKRLDNLGNSMEQVVRLEERQASHAGALDRAFIKQSEHSDRLTKLELEMPVTKLVRGWVIAGVLGICGLLLMQLAAVVWFMARSAPDNFTRGHNEIRGSGKATPSAAHVAVDGCHNDCDCVGMLVFSCAVPGGDLQTVHGDHGGGDGLLGGPRAVRAGLHAGRNHPAGYFRGLQAAGAGAGAAGHSPGADAGNLRPPREAERYRRDLVGVARATWGLNAPVATFAAQVHQESAWRPDARSRFASGLAQFTPDTADWISEAYRAELGANQPLNPAWALRALVRYDLHLYGRLAAASECDRMAMTLAAYNGGMGWVLRDKRLTAAAGQDPMRWWGHVERYTARADWAREENRGYPRRILLQLQPRYVSWGLGVRCP